MRLLWGYSFVVDLYFVSLLLWYLLSWLFSFGGLLFRFGERWGEEVGFFELAETFSLHYMFQDFFAAFWCDVDINRQDRGVLSP